MRIPAACASAVVAAAACFAGSAQAQALHLPQRLSIHNNVRLQFTGSALPAGGYYYGVVVLKPYKHYTRESPPPCATSSNMQRTDYGYPTASDSVVLELTPAPSRIHRWCRGGSYEGAVYAVRHAPPCSSAYPCTSEPYEHTECAGVAPGCRVLGVIAKPSEWRWPDPLPTPHASGTVLVTRFSLKFGDK